MRYTEAIVHADSLRPNSIPAEMKYAWIAEIDGKIAEAMGEETENPYPSDGDLLMVFPYDHVYELYLIAMYDIYNQDTALYQSDYAMFNIAFSEALAYIRRNNNPDKDQMFGVM